MEISTAHWAHMTCDSVQFLYTHHIYTPNHSLCQGSVCQPPHLLYKKLDFFCTHTDRVIMPVCAVLFLYVVLNFLLVVIMLCTDCTM